MKYFTHVHKCPSKVSFLFDSLLSDFSFLLLLSSSSEASFAKHPNKQQVWERLRGWGSHPMCVEHALDLIIVAITTKRSWGGEWGISLKKRKKEKESLFWSDFQNCVLTVNRLFEAKTL